MIVFHLFSLIILGVLIAAHPGEDHQPLSGSELWRRRAASAERHLVARKCALAISEYERRRVVARDISKEKHKPPTHTTSAHGPHVTEIKNTTCVTAPETVEGPYYIRNEYVRHDLREDQGGVKLVLDVGVIDTNTCEPLNNVFVELWAANATGVYGGYSGGGGPPPSGPPPGSTSGTATSSAPPAGTPPPPGGPGGPGGPSQGLARNETFLRGGHFTNHHGIVEITTVYPGFYQGRTAHIHAMVHVDWAESSNGTIVSDSGKLVHIGQFFFDEDWNDKVFATSPYTLNNQSRTLNEDDGILHDANTDGYNAFVDLDQIGDDISEGLYGYITVGVDASANYTIQNTNYNPVVISSLSHGVVFPSPHPHGHGSH